MKKTQGKTFAHPFVAVPLVLCGLFLGACNFAPRYDAPTTEAAPAFKEAVPAGDAREGWKPAEPQDTEVPVNWWEIYRDPDLDELERRVAVSNQTVAAAAANYRAARALVGEAQAAFFPTLSLDPSISRSRASASIANSGAGTGPAKTGTTAKGGATTTGGSTTSANATGGSTVPVTIYTLPLEASYQLDLWGSVRNTVAESRYSAQASAAQVVTALLSTQSQLAQDYFQLRAVDEQRRILDATLADYETSLHLVETLMQTGVDSSEDIAEAQNLLYAAQAEATDLGVARAQYEHAIAVLIGVPPAKFSLAVKPYDPTLPTVPIGLPSELLERRADIAAAERQVAAGNAAIGIARAAFFPSLTLSATGGYEALNLGKLLDWPNRFWSLGPQLAQTLFDGGERRAAVAQARALSDQAAANYRQTVLAAFQSVEDNLASLRTLAKELELRHKATVAAQRAVELSVVRYRNGVDSYVNVITAQNTFLTSREAELQTQLGQLIASVNLVNNLGGGWRAADWPRTQRFAGHPENADAGRPAESGGATSAPGGTAPPTPVPAPAARDIDPEELLRQDAADLPAAPTAR